LDIFLAPFTGFLAGFRAGFFFVTGFLRRGLDFFKVETGLWQNGLIGKRELVT